MRRISRPYAKALLSVAGSLEQATAVRNQLVELQATLAATPKLGAFFASPALPVDAKRRALDEIAARLDLLPLSRRLLQALLARHRMGRLDEVVAGITEAIQQRQGVAIAEVTTAEPLEAEERAQLLRVLEGKVGKRLQLREHVDPALLAGFVAQVESQLFDGSLRGQLDRLGKELAGP